MRATVGRSWVFIAGVFLTGAGAESVGQAASQKIVVLQSSSAGAYQEALEGFRSRVNFQLEILNLETNTDGGREAARRSETGELAAIVAIGSKAAESARLASHKIPVVYTMLLQPLRPGQENVSGVLAKIGVEEQLARIRKLLPNRRRLGVIYNPDSSGEDIAAARKFAEGNKFTIYAVPAVAAGEMDVPVSKITASMVDLLWMVVDESTASPAVFSKLLAQCARENLPLIGLSQSHVKAGALAAFCADFGDVGAQTAEYTRDLLASATSKQVMLARKTVVYVNGRVLAGVRDCDLSQFPDSQLIR